MVFRKKRPVLTREQSLASMPVRNPAVGAEKDDDGQVCINVPRKRTLWVNVLAKVFYVPDGRKIELDELGTYVWDLCDGQTSVRSIIKKFAKKYRLNRKEAEVSMVSYLKQLAKKGLIGIQVPETPEAKGEESNGQ